MTYKPCAVTKRVHRIKADYLLTPVARTAPTDRPKYRSFCTGDRWVTLGFLDGWLKHADAPTARLRRSLAEAAELDASQPQIGENELLLGRPWLPEYSPEEQTRYDALCEAFQMSNCTLIEQGPRVDHLSLDLQKLLRLGLNGLISELERHDGALDLNDPAMYPDMEAVRKHEFYECCLVELRALRSLAKRYARAAREKAETADEPRRSELAVIAETLERVPAEPARTFREAIQSAHFFLGTLFGLYPLGRPDRDFIAYYERDLAEGRITREEAQELIDNYCLAVSTRVFSRAACGFIVGGQDAAGNLVENELTYMFLTALDHIRMPDPNGALAVNARTSADILHYAAEMLSRGVTHPAFYNDEAIIRSLEQYGCRHEDAVNYIHTTCAEISIVGRSRAHTTLCCVVLPRLLTRAVREAAENASFETLFYAFALLIEETLRADLMRYFQRLVEAGRNGNEPMRVCALVEDCPARGKSIYEGGERYTFLQPILVGFATAVDSLCAIRQLVYNEKVLTLKAFLSIVDRNFEGEESLRQRLIRRLPHYGNNDVTADSMAARLAGTIEEIFRSRRLPAADVMAPGTFSYIMHATRGMHDGATFDGRLAHTSYSDGCGPVQGRDTHGPTAMVLSLTSWDQSLFLAGMVVNVKFTPTHLSADGGALFIAMLRAFIERGGLEMQVNAVRRETLDDAKAHPDAHGDLIVRIGGYSDYFTRLSPVLQDEIIARTEY